MKYFYLVCFLYVLVLSNSILSRALHRRSHTNTKAKMQTTFKKPEQLSLKSALKLKLLKNSLSSLETEKIKNKKLLKKVHQLKKHADQVPNDLNKRKNVHEVERLTKSINMILSHAENYKKDRKVVSALRSAVDSHLKVVMSEWSECANNEEWNLMSRKCLAAESKNTGDDGEDVFKPAGNRKQGEEPDSNPEKDGDEPDSNPEKDGDEPESNPEKDGDEPESNPEKDGDEPESNPEKDGDEPDSNPEKDGDEPESNPEKDGDEPEVNKMNGDGTGEDNDEKDGDDSVTGDDNDEKSENKMMDSENGDEDEQETGDDNDENTDKNNMNDNDDEEEDED